MRPSRRVAISKYCLRRRVQVRIGGRGLRVRFYEKPFIKIRPASAFVLGLRFRPAFARFSRPCPVWDIKKKIWIKESDPEGRLGYAGKNYFSGTSPVACGLRRFFPIFPYQEAAFLTVDGRGASGRQPASGAGKDNRIEIHGELRFPHSTGPCLYSAFTYYTGFPGELGGIKLNGAGSLRRNPPNKDLILRELIDLKEGRLLSN